LRRKFKSLGHNNKTQGNNNETESFKPSPKSKINDDNNNVIYDNRSTSSETDCSSLSSSDKENDSRPSSSLYGNINKNEAQKNVPGESFQYRTMNGSVIKSVIPPGKGLKVHYKVSTFTCLLRFRPFIVEFVEINLENFNLCISVCIPSRGLKFLSVFFFRLHQTFRLPSHSLTLHQAPSQWLHPRVLQLIQPNQLGLHHQPLHQLFQSQSDPFKVLIKLSFYSFKAHTSRSLSHFLCNLFNLISK
jgi:hypothetical protein